ncbi:Diacylglycerol kinase epsilon [Armadillidium nasatum]|uniref:Diacylglycerol kinase epsilon n=1 Tax=Armadillidium nasatum TaxID=96803 RepID=A0A5N5T163_9CRUS|nr:Diacylglycerol kinase epsilon [Armadillidium nasatum]
MKMCHRLRAEPFSRIISLLNIPFIIKNIINSGNLPLGATCDVCEDECGTEIGLSDFRCCWCQGCCHASCLNKLSEICDLGHLRQFVVPPNNIKVRSGRIRKRLVIKEVIPPTIPDWSPVIVIGNCSSGSSEAEQILSAFRHVLNPAQVVDLSKRSPEEALEWCHLLSDITCKVIVAGGDGTVGWVFDTIFKLKLKVFCMKVRYATRFVPVFI